MPVNSPVCLYPKRIIKNAVIARCSKDVYSVSIFHPTSPVTLTKKDLPAVRIQGIPQGIADEVDGHDEYDDQRAGRNPEPWLLGEHGQGLSTVEHIAEAGGRRLNAEAKEA